MKTTSTLLCLVMIIQSSGAFAQSKGQMAFTSSSKNVNKQIRNAWTAYGDAKIEEGNAYLQQALAEDPDCGMIYASLFAATDEKRDENMKIAETKNLSSDEKLFLEALKASHNKTSGAEYIDPLLKKYPNDNYLHLIAMFLEQDVTRAIAIGENIIKRNPKFAPPYNLLGYSYMKQDDLAKAEANFDKYISLRPDLANPYDSKGDYLMHVGKNDEAKAMFEKAVSMGMKNSQSKADRAAALIKYPQPAEAEVSEMKDMITSSSSASLKGDVEGVLRPYCDQSIEIFGNQMSNIGMPNIRKRTSSMFNYGSFSKQEFVPSKSGGTGPIAFVAGPATSVWKEKNNEKESDNSGNAIFLFRKQDDGAWKILAHHFYERGDSDESEQDVPAIRQLIQNWSDNVKPGEVLGDTHVDLFTRLYSAQAIEIYPGQRCNVGIANLRARWTGMAGVKVESNSLEPLVIETLGRRAIACGIASQSIYNTDSNELTRSQYPWAMILTKEKDDQWRILAIHWTTGHSLQ